MQLSAAAFNNQQGGGRCESPHQPHDRPGHGKHEEIHAHFMASDRGSHMTCFT